jgi:hypothetical protein
VSGLSPEVILLVALAAPCLGAMLMPRPRWLAFYALAVLTILAAFVSWVRAHEPGSSELAKTMIYGLSLWAVVSLVVGVVLRARSFGRGRSQ